MQRQLLFVLDDDPLDDFGDNINAEILRKGNGIKLYQDASRISQQQANLERQRELEEYRHEMATLRPKPKISENSKMINNRRNLQSHSDNFYEYNQKWVQDRDARIQLEKDYIAKQQFDQANAPAYKQQPLRNKSSNRPHDFKNLDTLPKRLVSRDAYEKSRTPIQRKKCCKPESPTFKPEITDKSKALARPGKVYDR